MGIFVDSKTRVVVQGITGRDGSFHASQMAEYGTKVVAGVTPGKGGLKENGVPVFNTVVEAVQATDANTSCIFVPPAFAADAILEAADAGCRLVVCITEGVPTVDMLRVIAHLERTGTRLIGPNCPGLMTVGVSRVGIMPNTLGSKGKVGVVSRLGTLTYEVMAALSEVGIGQSTAIGIGGDPVIGTTFLDCLTAFEADPGTEAIALIGEIGGTDEERAAEYIKKKVKKPVVAFVAGRTAPPGKRMGHAGAIISGGTGTAAEKVAAFEAVGVPVADTPVQLAEITAERIAKYRARKRAAAARKKKTAQKTTAKKAVKKPISKKTAKKTTRKKTNTKKIVRKPVRKKTAAGKTTKKTAPKTTATTKKSARRKTGKPVPRRTRRT
jgi:succinyl-CoA synthetase alpha subunit